MEATTGIPVFSFPMEPERRGRGSIGLAFTVVMGKLLLYFACRSPESGPSVKIVFGFTEATPGLVTVVVCFGTQLFCTYEVVM
jgi:hypothetical protein